MSENKDFLNKLPLKVPNERWKQAQEWELAIWRRQNHAFAHSWWIYVKTIAKRFLGRSLSDFGDDWNFWWADKFNGYQAIPEELESAIELGCGPYTNMRLILCERKIKHVFCSDPLAKHYIAFKDRWLAEAWKKCEILIDDHPLEECPFASDYFNLVVLINVLDHVKDSLLCLRQAVRITKTSGYLLVGQDLSNMENIHSTGNDIGHPIRIDHRTLDLELMSQFEPVLYKILSRDEGRNPLAHYGTYIFIGKKR